MSIRRALFALPALLLVLAPSGASAAGAKVEPVVTISLVKAAGSSLRPVITTSFPVPEGVPAAEACSGAVSVKVPIATKMKKVRGKRRPVAVFSTKSASLQNRNPLCTASAAPRVPLKLAGKRLRYTVSFRGNTRVKRFSLDRRFRVTAAAVNPDNLLGTAVPQEGFWFGYLPGNTDVPDYNISFYVSHGPVVYAMSTGGGSGVPFACSDGTFASTSQSIFGLGSTGSPFALTTPPATLTGVDGTSAGRTLRSDMTLAFSSPTAGTLTLRSSGEVYSNQTGTGHTGCKSGVLTFDLRAGSSIL